MKIGDVVCLTILDHAAGPGHVVNKPIVFEVYGRVIDIGKKHISIAHWLEACGGVDNNTEVSVILKSAIEGKRVLR